MPRVLDANKCLVRLDVHNEHRHNTEYCNTLCQYRNCNLGYNCKHIAAFGMAVMERFM